MYTEKDLSNFSMKNTCCGYSLEASVKHFKQVLTTSVLLKKNIRNIQALRMKGVTSGPLYNIQMTNEEHNKYCTSTNPKHCAGQAVLQNYPKNLDPSYKIFRIVLEEETPILCL